MPKTGPEVEVFLAQPELRVRIRQLAGRYVVARNSTGHDTARDDLINRDYSRTGMSMSAPKLRRHFLRPSPCVRRADTDFAGHLPGARARVVLTRKR